MAPVEFIKADASPPSLDAPALVNNKHIFHNIILFINATNVLIVVIIKTTV